MWLQVYSILSIKSIIVLLCLTTFSVNSLSLKLSYRANLAFWLYTMGNESWLQSGGEGLPCKTSSPLWLALVASRVDSASYKSRLWWLAEPTLVASRADSVG